MSGTGTSSGGSGGGGDQGASAAPDLPERPNVIVEEKAGQGDGTLRYQYAAEKGDRVTFTVEVADQEQFCVLFTVKRYNSEKVEYLRRSKPIPNKLKDELVFENPNLDVKKRMYIVKFKKKADFNLDKFFRPDSPPV